MTLVLGALEGEIAESLAGLEKRSTTRWNGFAIHHGRIDGAEVCLAVTGVGKSLSAMLCQHLIDLHSPSRIIFTGVAGALNPALEIGDTVVARDCIIHDMDATALGFKRGEIPYTPHRVITCDTTLVSRAAAIRPVSGKAIVGRIVTGDQFVSSVDKRNELRLSLDGDAAEMEGASVGLVATVNNIPFLLIRTISDKADGKAHIDFADFLKFASRNSWHYLRAIVANE